jgi:hypothetical protein
MNDALSLQQLRVECNEWFSYQRQHTRLILPINQFICKQYSVSNVKFKTTCRIAVYKIISNYD